MQVWIYLIGTYNNTKGLVQKDKCLGATPQSKTQLCIPYTQITKISDCLPDSRKQELNSQLKCQTIIFLKANFESIWESLCLCIS